MYDSTEQKLGIWLMFGKCFDCCCFPRPPGLLIHDLTCLFRGKFESNFLQALMKIGVIFKETLETFGLVEISVEGIFCSMRC